MRRMTIHRMPDPHVAADDQLRRRGLRVLHIGPWLVTWQRHPEDWRL